MQRIDIFSQKGGVGKTSIAILMAMHFYQNDGKSVLIVDADLTGSCIGDAIIPKPKTELDEWLGLSQLICGSPEKLNEAIAQLPIYEFDPATKSYAPLAKNPTKPLFTFCLSHLNAVPPSDANVLRALAGHESSGDWVRFVIRQVINMAIEVLGKDLVVIVDHSPGMSALQQAALNDIRDNVFNPKTAKSSASGANEHVALIVTEGDRADINMCINFQEGEESTRDNLQRKSGLSRPLGSYLRFVGNNLDGTPPREIHKLRDLHQIPRDPAVAEANKNGEIAAGITLLKPTANAIAELCQWAVFQKLPAKRLVARKRGARK